MAENSMPERNRILSQLPLLGETVDVSPEQDWLAVPDRSEAAWDRTLKALRAGHRRLLEAAAGIGDKELDSAG